MDRSIAGIFAILMLLASCSKGAQRRERDFDVISEGSVGGVTSTLAAPGETIPPLTNTSFDTTTAFEMIATTSSATTDDASLAGTLQIDPTATPGSRAPGSPPSQIMIRRSPAPEPRAESTTAASSESATTSTTAPTETAGEIPTPTPDNPEPEEEIEPPEPPPTDTNPPEAAATLRSPSGW